MHLPQHWDDKHRELNSRFVCRFKNLTATAQISGLHRSTRDIYIYIYIYNVSPPIKPLVFDNRAFRWSACYDNSSKPLNWRHYPWSSLFAVRMEFYVQVLAKQDHVKSAVLMMLCFRLPPPNCESYVFILVYLLVGLCDCLFGWLLSALRKLMDKYSWNWTTPNQLKIFPFNNWI